MIFYIADIHFGDERIFNKCSRPFKNSLDYEQELCRRWNSKVNNNDTVYVLGDLAQDELLSVTDIFKKLNGKKHLLLGNHDEKLIGSIKQSNVFETIDFIKLIDDNHRKVCVCHYPLMDWIEFNRGGFHVYGHVHNKTIEQGQAYAQIKEYYKDKPAFNAGVDVIGFEPVTLDEMIMLKEKHTNEPYIN